MTSQNKNNNRRTFILPYKMGSRSTVALSRAINALIIRRTGSKYVPLAGDRIINWGNSRNLSGFDFFKNAATGFSEASLEVLNKPSRVLFCSNKENFFNLQKEAGNEAIIPRFWQTKEAIPDDAFPVVCRTVLSGHSGAGIVIANNRSSLVDAQLYVEYVKKADEYRIHVGRMVGGQSIIIVSQRKARSLSVPNESVNWRIRTHANGFVFARQDVSVPNVVKQAAIKAFEACELDFGAVDVIYNEALDRAFVLEINTAPGLEGSTVTDYASFFLQRRFSDELE